MLFNTRSPYDCTQEEIDDYTKEYRSEAFFASIEEATQEITHILNPFAKYPPPVEAALCRLKDARFGVKWGPDTIIKSVHDLDTALFGGILCRKIAVSWVEKEKMASDKELAPRVRGITKGSDSSGICRVSSGVCRVLLNSDSMFDQPDPQQQMFSTMIHELVVSSIKESRLSC